MLAFNVLLLALPAVVDSHFVILVVAVEDQDALVADRTFLEEGLLVGLLVRELGVVARGTILQVWQFHMGTFYFRLMTPLSTSMTFSFCLCLRMICFKGAPSTDSNSLLLSTPIIRKPLAHFVIVLFCYTVAGILRYMCQFLHLVLIDT